MHMTRRESVVAEGHGAGSRCMASGLDLEAWQARGAMAPTPSRARALRVLVVDDDEDTADTLSLLVQLWGHDVRSACDGAVVLEMTAAYRPDVLLLDVAMPRINGYQLARALRRQFCCKHTLLVAITGYADTAHQLRGMEAGFDHYLIKPADPSMVEKLLSLERRRLAGFLEGVHATPPACGAPVVDAVASERLVRQVRLH
jgi:CheY-like chemotaxis protein